jgi:hypothetical protein
MILNEYKMHRRSVVYEEYTCDGHTMVTPRYGCRVYLDCVLRGVASDYPNKRSAKEAAASQAAGVMGLI